MAPVRAPLVAVLPEGVRDWAADAVVAGGGQLVGPDRAEARVWTATGFEPGFQPADLVSLLEDNPAISWIQLPWAGVEPYAEAGVFDRGHTWTSGKGVYARPCAEHALALTLAGLRHLKAFAEARNWSPQAGTSLIDGRVSIFGGGGITEELVALLHPFGCRITVVRKRPAAMNGVQRVLGWDDRQEALVGADAVVLALALTPETDGAFGEAQFKAMDDHAWLVNVARGRHVRTDDLVAALRQQRIGGAALDVTFPEPLPEGHPLWSLPNCLITPHTANTYAMAIPLLTARITDNVRRYARGEAPIGAVDPDLGY
jgi:phosphoglycerate dehydrogenase-like enzyme